MNTHPVDAPTLFAGFFARITIEPRPADSFREHFKAITNMTSRIPLYSHRTAIRLHVLTMLALLWLIPGAAQAAEKRLVIIDDDIGGVRPAQLMALQSPDVKVLGLTIVSGSTWRDENVAHARRLAEISGHPNIDIVPGAQDPLLNTEKETALWEKLYGKLVWKGAWMKHWVKSTKQTLPPYHAPDVIPDMPLGNPTVVKASNEIAANYLIKMVHKYPGRISIIATGPMTNLALAQSLDPDFARLARELVYMGGSLNPQRKLDNRSAREFAREYLNSPREEFNFRWDPEAVKITLRAPWRKVVMVPVDPSTATQLTARLRQRMSAADTPIDRALRTIPLGFPLWDELATAVWLDPSLITKSDRLYISVDTEFGPNYGDTLSWAPAYKPELDLGPKETVVRAVDVDRLERLMVRLMTQSQPPAVGAPVP